MAEMEREQIFNAVLWPVDQVLDVIVQLLENSNVFEPASSAFYNGLKKILLTNFKISNELAIEGAERVPLEGGVILAANHQSWLDVQVLGAACPRRVHFIAKSEFEHWPVLRHLVKLSKSVFIHRGGDEAALQSITDALRQGWGVAIFPEGTIPGEENIPRRAVDPNTGLLPGHTGVVRLALRANVPIVPVGISGTGRAFPPEVYPRLEILRLPRNTPIRIRFGDPIYLDDYREQSADRMTVRELTDKVMMKISGLIDHRCNYAPIEVPIEPPPKHEKIGVLLLHGFTSHIATVSGLVPYLEKADIKYEMPILRGHGTRYQDLHKVSPRQWYAEAEWALIKLFNHVDRVVVVGLSMGGLLALELAMRQPDKIAGIVTVAAAIKFVDPMSILSPYLNRFVKYWPSPNAFNDLSLRANSKNYTKFPTKTFASLYGYSRKIAQRLREVYVPIRILQSKKDQVVAPEAANIIYERVSSPIREIIWYEENGHEMMQDLEAEKVFADIMEFVHLFELHPKED